jgi:hypothetical protein
MLTLEEAQQLVLSRLNGSQNAPVYMIEQERTIERPFGWLFFVKGSGTPVQAESVSSRQIIVNKHAGQVIGSSIDHTPERFIEVFESLLAESQANGRTWCLTLSDPSENLPGRRLAQKAKEMGLYEIR